MISKKIFLRILANTFLLVGVFLFPYWLTVVIGLIIAVFIPYYYEFVAFLAFNEMLYHTGSAFDSGAMTFFFPLLFFISIEASRNIVRERLLQP